MESFWFGILGGIVAWFATMLIGQPFYELIGLRREAARLLHLYEPTKQDGRWAIAATLEERSKAYQDCAAKLLAFHSSQSLVSACAGLPPLSWRPKEAGELLWKLAPLGPGASERFDLRAGIAKAFNLKL
jgi:hypothetical protein